VAGVVVDVLGEQAVGTPLTRQERYDGVGRPVTHGTSSVGGVGCTAELVCSHHEPLIVNWIAVD
jgi:hypothetical protein